MGVSSGVRNSNLVLPRGRYFPERKLRLKSRSFPSSHCVDIRVKPNGKPSERNPAGNDSADQSMKLTKLVYVPRREFSTTGSLARSCIVGKVGVVGTNMASKPLKAVSISLDKSRRRYSASKTSTRGKALCLLNDTSDHRIHLNVGLFDEIFDGCETLCHPGTFV